MEILTKEAFSEKLTEIGYDEKTFEHQKRQLENCVEHTLFKVRPRIQGKVTRNEIAGPVHKFLVE